MSDEPTSKELIMMTISEIQKESWNAAIEAAAKRIEHLNCNYEQYEIEADEIRKLKK